MNLSRAKLTLLVLLAIVIQISAASTEEEIRKRQREKREKLAEERKREWEEYLSQRHHSRKDGTALDRADLMYFLSQQKKASAYPRHILQGIRRGLTAVLIGSLSSVTSAIMLPLVSSLKAGWKGGILGGILGLTFAMVTFGTSVIYGGLQFIIGMILTPKALSAHFSSKRWDPDIDEYIVYYLHDEADELSTSSLHGGEVYDLTYYQALGVEANATSKQIKQAYFQRAKETHPDKNPSDKTAAEKFLQLHKAYQTLMDDKARAAYDESGSVAEDAPPFDADVFFAILFGSQAVEPYIGDLSVASFWNQIIRMSTGDRREERMVKMFIGNNADTKEKRRQVDIAINIWNRIESYAVGQLSKEQFKTTCQAEADMIAETPYGEQFLKAIGTVLKLKTSIYADFRNPLRTPRGIFYQLVRQKRRWTELYRLVQETLFLVKNVVDKRDVDGTISPESLELLLPIIVELAWKFVLRDISSTVEKAISRLLDASDLPGKRDKRVQALQILADAFLSRAKSANNGVEDDMMKAVRCKVAFQIAQNKKKGDDIPADSEQMIKQAKAEESRKQRRKRAKVMV